MWRCHAEKYSIGQTGRGDHAWPEPEAKLGTREAHALQEATAMEFNSGTTGFGSERGLATLDDGAIRATMAMNIGVDD